MSLILETYRENAEAARLEVERSALPNVRARAIDSPPGGRRWPRSSIASSKGRSGSGRLLTALVRTMAEE
jgi:hypothetical protein